MFGGCFDVSHNNGPLKWSLVPQSYRLVFVKASQGTKFVDNRFTENREGAEDTDRFVIPYHFLNAEPANLQAAHFMNVAGLRHGDQTMLDWEGQPPPPLQILEEMIECVRIATNRAPIIYHGIYDLVSKKVNSCPWMVPKWGPKPDSKFKWLFWQDSPRGVVEGIQSFVDHDWFNGDESALEAFFKKGTLAKNLIADSPKEW